MRLRITVAMLLIVALVGAGYVLHGQTAKDEVRLEFEISRNGSIIAKPITRSQDGATASMHFSDGTDIKVTSTIVRH